MAAEHMSDATTGYDAVRLENRRMLILYGSETGNSQDLAGELERLAERLHFQTQVYEMNDVELNSLLQYPLIIFVVSTTGQGEIPQNALKFWKSLLRKRLPPNCLQLASFTTFGLGDSSYSKYNWAVRKLHKRLEQLGATEFFPRGEADERHEDGIDGTFLSWSLSLRSHLLREYPLPKGLSPISSDVQLPPKFTIELVPNMDSTDVSMPDLNASSDETSASTSPVGASPSVNDANQNPQRPDQEPILDRTAALFSHVDTPHPEVLEQALRAARMSIHSNTYSARLSENTARQILGGVDILDRPNVLRDHPAKYSLEEATGHKDTLPPPDLLPVPGAWAAKVRENYRLTPKSHWQDVRHILIDVYPRPSSVARGELDRFGYLPGDILTIYPKNFPADVQDLIDLMGWQDVADLPFEHHARERDALYSRPKNCHPLPRSTLRQLLLHNYDITAIPKRVFFHDVAFYTDDAAHKERLREFANPALSDEFYDYTSRPRRSILEVLQDFPSIKIPFQHVPSVFPVMRGRDYSIASGGSLLKNDESQFTRVEIVVALVKYKTVLRKTRQGLCSRYLASLRDNVMINITHKENNSLQVAWTTRPLLAIAPGTGIAPIRAWLWDRLEERQAGEAVLFFGGRNQKADFYFKDEWDDLRVKVFTAFSRDQEQKIYVQDRIREHAPVVCEYLRKGAVVCICGSSGKMPEAVRLALYDAMVIGRMAPDRHAAAQLLHSSNPLWEEVW
ncbi:riboflavin synthase domain-like protein [Hypoxylon sp. NC1633]|nr:riboflavin synthase domain-like protein [Hypoxylon sp. NC1633]